MKKTLKETPSQTAGPYVHIGTLPRVAGIERGPADFSNTGLAGGTPIIIEGVIRDGAGELVRDALVEIWQADSTGKFAENGRAGWARAHTDFETGKFRFETVKPGPVAWVDGSPQAPHVTLMVFARGINIHLLTRIYFADEAEVNNTDPLLRTIEDDAARQTLLAVPEPGSNNAYRFDVVLQGPRETVFLDI